MTTQTLHHPTSRPQPETHKRDSDSFVNRLKQIFNWKLLMETFQEWSRDGAAQLAASLAYYTVTALAQLLIGILAIAAFFYSGDVAQQQLVAQANRFVGSQGGELVETIVQNADQPELARVAGLLSLALLLWSGSNIFYQLQNSLNTVWGVELRKDLSLIDKVKRRLFPLLVVVGIGILVVAASMVGAALSAASGLLNDSLPGGAILWQILNYVINLAIFTLLFGLIFKLLPDVEIAWRDVWPGAALTALLFVIGQLLLGWYLNRQSSASVYGAAGSLIVLLLWIYYSAQIFLFGAEFTQIYATRYGDGVKPDDDAVPLGSQVVAKPAAIAAGSNGRGQPAWAGDKAATRREVGSMARAWQQAGMAHQDLYSLSGLTTSLVSDIGTLARLQMHLIRTEIKESLLRAGRGAAFTAGGGLLLYGAALFVLICLTLFVNALMPLWLAALLVGLLLVAEGWILMVWARRKAAEAAKLPERAIASTKEDIKTVKAHLTD
jgi:membrane protein